MTRSIGKNIRKLRKERNLTQEELAELLNITSQAVSKWENETGMPDISQIIPLASIFGVSIDTLFGKTNLNEQIIQSHFALDDTGVSVATNAVGGHHG